MMHDTRYSPLDSAEIVSAPPTPKGDDDDGWTAIMPVPDGIGYWPADGRGKPADKDWRYLDPEERLLVILARWDLVSDGTKKKDKKIRPFTWCRHKDGKTEWREKHFPEPRPLYGLDRLAARPHAPVMVCEGEKATDAATVFLQNISNSLRIMVSTRLVVARRRRIASAPMGASNWRLPCPRLP